MAQLDLKTRLELKVPPLLVVLIAMALMYGIAHSSFTLPMGLSGTVLSWSLVIAFAGTGLGLMLMGVVSFKRASTTPSPINPEQASSLVRSGLYRYTRNPMYLGMLLLLTAWGVYLDSWLCLVVLPAFVAYIGRFQIAPEERALFKLFGNDYRMYKEEVNRWFGYKNMS
ncbi:isoprenylcysteine carboxylmethyltransferase family protein [Endozoicomonas sp. OPT23]|uniref:methyltransferase family protein n=1 Tax=Endozoicomonas sp. OPT23 TaxID=2072845 RepID=UPI00129C00E3|nr:isoprenylcysteine carboxylmethyltransferase family protein [Endozoicomonas sp. OPT23]MRI34782.1 isoprenylcysteine carboxylmethyltransferase family protein [Endozoicomonas sp. OPT23]